MPSYKSVFLLLVFLFIRVNSFNLQEDRVKHQAKSLSNDEFSSLALLSNMTHFEQILDKILIPRVVGSPGHKTVKSVIKSSMKALNWEITSDIFMASTPLFGTLQFENIIATLNPKAKRYLVLACHYDSKYFAEYDFLGATDSAVPCAMMINLAHTMKELLGSNETDISLKFCFLDGEEAFVTWSDSDSLYGSRNLAAKWEKTLLPGNSNLLHTIDLFVLLDLLGAPNPIFYSYFKNTEHWHHLMNKIEKSLSELGHMEQYSTGRDDKMYFRSQSNDRGIEDDHIPFLKRGVPILHVISNPFPNVWHTPKDSRDAIDMATTNNLLKIFRAFVASYLHL